MKPQLTVEVPPKMRLLPRDKRGYPVPWIVQRDLTKRPFFVINDTEKVLLCGLRGLCGICGRKLERDIWLIGGPGAAFHEAGAYIDPPMHGACARYALRVCPYLGAPYSGRVDRLLVSQGQWPPEMKTHEDASMIPEQPPFFVLGRTSAARLGGRPPEAPRFYAKRPWLAVELWHDGRIIDEATARERLAADDRWPWTPADLAYWPKEVA